MTRPLDPELLRLGLRLAQIDRWLRDLAVERAQIAALLIATLDATEAEMEAHS